jgi:CubicO group peptidase (beta-lactamase class C family)
MSELKIRVDPESMGFDPIRLQRIQTHFDAYVADGRLPGWLATVSRGDELVWVGKSGYRNREEELDVTNDTIWRIYSMTKPVVAIAAMMLYEEGVFDLNDDVGQWIEELREPRIFVGGTAADPETEPAHGPVRVHHLMSQTSGLTYGFQRNHPVDEMHRNMGYDFSTSKDADLVEAVHDWCSAPLLFEPGTHFNYSVATDVLGRLIEIWSGQTLDVFLKERIFDPLGMHDTAFWCPEDKQDRLAMLYLYLFGEVNPWVDLAKLALRQPKMLLGGSGLASTAYDYQRFMSMLLRGGELDGVRLMSSRTLELMTQNHLPDDVDLREFAVDSYADIDCAGIGFGLGFAVVTDAIKNRSLVSEGSFYWGGAASTLFWVDPAEDLTVSFFTQLVPPSTYALRRELSQLVYQALAD